MVWVRRAEGLMLCITERFEGDVCYAILTRWEVGLCITERFERDVCYAILTEWEVGENL